MTVSHKHYRQVADIIQDAWKEPFSTELSPHYVQGWVLSYVASGLAEMFTQENPLFDRNLFLAACFPKMDEAQEGR